MSYEALDNIADSFIPILLVLSLASVILRVRFNSISMYKSTKELGLLVSLVAIVYALMFIDGELGIWYKLGGLDYSTHTALALVLTVFLSLSNKQYLLFYGLSFVAYVMLMLYQKYHTVLDIAVTGFVVGIMAAAVAMLTKNMQLTSRSN